MLFTQTTHQPRTSHRGTPETGVLFLWRAAPFEKVDSTFVFASSLSAIALLYCITSTSIVTPPPPLLFDDSPFINPLSYTLVPSLTPAMSQFRRRPDLWSYISFSRPSSRADDHISTLPLRGGGGGVNLDDPFEKPGRRYPSPFLANDGYYNDSKPSWRNPNARARYIKIAGAVAAVLLIIYVLVPGGKSRASSFSSGLYHPVVRSISPVLTAVIRSIKQRPIGVNPRSCNHKMQRLHLSFQATRSVRPNG